MEQTALEQIALDIKWYEAMRRRASVRAYSPLDAERFENLAAFAQGLSGNGVRLRAHRGDIFRKLLGGRIRGTDAFVSVICEAGGDAAAAGYRGEALVLQAAELGVGSCWVGASMDRGAAQEIAGLAKGEKMPCVIALGATEGGGDLPVVPDYLRKRKSIEELSGLDDRALSLIPLWQQRALECARIAPSAMNAQPWRFEILKGESGIGIVQRSSNFGYGRLDSGIAMLHMELGAQQAGVTCSFKLEKNYSKILLSK